MKEEDLKEKDLKEIMVHFNGLNNTYLASLHAHTTEKRRAYTKEFYAHRDWLRQHGIEVCLYPQGIWWVDESTEENL